MTSISVISRLLDQFLAQLNLFTKIMDNRSKLLAVLVHLTGIVYIVMIVLNALGGIGYEGISNNLTAISWKWKNLYVHTNIFVFQFQLFLARTRDRFPINIRCTSRPRDSHSQYGVSYIFFSEPARSTVRFTN